MRGPRPRRRNAWMTSPMLPALAAARNGLFFFSSRRRHTRSDRDWSSDVCSSDLIVGNGPFVLESWEHHRTMVLRKNRHFFGAKDIVLDKVVIPIIPNTAGALP